MKKTPSEIAGYTVLPLVLPPTPSYPKPATHHLYIRAHEPRIPDDDTPRSLFLVNIPIDTTELHLRHLFGTQLAAGRVEKVHFESVPTKSKGGASVAQGALSKKKRKRVTADELQSQLDEIELPGTWDRTLHKSGAHAIVVFVDGPARDASLKAVKKVAGGRRSGKDGAIVWGDGVEERLPALGMQRYLKHEQAVFPARAEILRAVSDYMTVFEQVSEARKREVARRAQEPDEDGFVTVTSGPKLTEMAHEDEARALVERQRKKQEGLEDFYRFQSREKRKQRQNELLRQFGEDKKRLEDLKRRKGKIRPE